MTTRQKLQRQMRAVAFIANTFDLKQRENGEHWVYRPGASYAFYSTPKGEVERHPEMQGNPAPETISEMIRLGYMVPQNGVYLMTALGIKHLMF